MGYSAAEILKLARTRSGLTQTQLGEYAGVTQSVVSAYESGKREPSFSTLERLVKATGFDLDIALNAAPSERTLRARVHSHRDELLRVLHELGAVNVRLFGSVARGDDRPGSDVDLLVDLREDVGLFSLARMGGEAERILGMSVDVVPANSLREEIAASVLMDAQPL